MLPASNMQRFVDEYVAISIIAVKTACSGVKMKEMIDYPETSDLLMVLITALRS